MRTTIENMLATVIDHTNKGTLSTEWANEVAKAGLNKVETNVLLRDLNVKLTGLTDDIAFIQAYYDAL